MKTITMSTRYIMYVCKPYTPVGAIPINSTLAPNWQNIKVLAIFSPLCIPLCASFPIYQKSRSALKQVWPASYSPLFMSFNNNGSCCKMFIFIILIPYGIRKFHIVQSPFVEKFTPFLKFIDFFFCPFPFLSTFFMLLLFKCTLIYQLWQTLKANEISKWKLFTEYTCSEKWQRGKHVCNFFSKPLWKGWRGLGPLM